jgi:predicted nucleic acid-binding protein
VLRNWLKRLRDRKAIIFRSGKLPPIHQGALLRMKFDRSDLPFVAVAFQSKDKLLVSEDSDYTQKVCDYLQQQLQVKVLSLSQALEIARGTQDP